MSNDMNCTDFKPAIDDLLDDTLAAEYRAALMAHHDQCPLCQASLYQALQLQQAVLPEYS